MNKICSILLKYVQIHFYVSKLVEIKCLFLLRSTLRILQRISLEENCHCVKSKLQQRMVNYKICTVRTVNDVLVDILGLDTYVILFPGYLSDQKFIDSPHCMNYHKVASSRPVYYSILDPLGQSSQYISFKSPLHKQSLLCGLTIDSIVQNFGFFFQRHKLENLKQMLTWGICFRM